MSETSSERKPHITKEMVLDFLKKHKARRYTTNRIHIELKTEHPDYAMTYQEIDKWLAVLTELNKIKYSFIGKLRVYWCDA